MEPKCDWDELKCSKLPFYLKLLLARKKKHVPASLSQIMTSLLPPPFVISSFTSPSHHLLPSSYCPQTIIVTKVWEQSTLALSLTHCNSLCQAQFHLRKAALHHLGRKWHKCVFPDKCNTPQRADAGCVGQRKHGDYSATR